MDIFVEKDYRSVGGDRETLARLSGRCSSGRSRGRSPWQMLSHPAQQSSQLLVQIKTRPRANCWEARKGTTKYTVVYLK